MYPRMLPGDSQYVKILMSCLLYNYWASFFLLLSVRMLHFSSDPTAYCEFLIYPHVTVGFDHMTILFSLLKSYAQGMGLGQAVAMEDWLCSHRRVSWVPIRVSPPES